MKIHLKTLILILVSMTHLMSSLPAFAQSSGSHGGNITEVELKHLLHDLSDYLKTDEAKKQFPEMVRYDKVHQNETIANIADELNPSLVHHAVTADGSHSRDCVGHQKKGIRYFECNQAVFPNTPDGDESSPVRKEYYEKLYRILFHEVLVQAKLEKPLLKEVPSAYNISSRLSVHLTYHPEWKLGSGEATNSDFEENVCRIYGSTLPEHHTGFRAQIYTQTSTENLDSKILIQINPDVLPGSVFVDAKNFDPVPAYFQLMHLILTIDSAGIHQYRVHYAKNNDDSPPEEVGYYQLEGVGCGHLVSDRFSNSVTNPASDALALVALAYGEFLTDAKFKNYGKAMQFFRNQVLSAFQGLK